MATKNLKRKSTDIEKTAVDTEHDTNPDPITGAPGSHPVGAGVGAATLGTAGAAIGSAAGPIGTVVGAVAGGLAGGLAGKAAAEAIDPTAEDAYWRENYRTRPYAANTEYDTWRPAYQYGWESWTQYSGRRFDEVEPELRKDWTQRNAKSKLDWEKAKHAARDAWDRIDTRK